MFCLPASFLCRLPEREKERERGGLREREQKSVKLELKEVEQQLEELLTRQSRLLERQTELETVLQNQATKKRQAADTQWEKTGRVYCLCRIRPPRNDKLRTHSGRK